MNKELSDALKIIAGKLPMVNQSTHEVHFIKGADILEDGAVTEIEGKKIDAGKMYKMNYPVLIAANHFRRMKRAWMKNGKEGVRHYMNGIEKLVNKNK